MKRHEKWQPTQSPSRRGSQFVMAYGCQLKNLKKSLYPPEIVAIMRVCKKVFVSSYSSCRGKNRSMWDVKQGSGHEKTDCVNSRLFHRTYDSCAESQV